jgi:hypothetical protein
MKTNSLVVLNHALLALALVLSLTCSVTAQADKYKPGEKIEYKDTSVYPPKWEQGVYVKATSDESQPIIRQKPSQFFPEGFERATSWENIRPLGQQPADPVKPKDDPNKPIGLPPNPADGKGCAAVLTENDIVAYLEKNLGDDPFKDSRKKEQVEKDLAKMIRDCGLSFRYKGFGSPFYKRIEKFRLLTTATYRLSRNFQKPVDQAWYLGTWRTGNQSTYGWVIDSRSGTLTINGNGTYTWKVGGSDPPSKVIRGNWRAATDAEMAVSWQGGAGIVLLNSYGGFDRLVREDDESTLPGKWIDIADLGTRGARHYGVRN